MYIYMYIFRSSTVHLTVVSVSVAGFQEQMLTFPMAALSVYGMAHDVVHGPSNVVPFRFVFVVGVRLSSREPEKELHLEGPG